MTVDTTTLTLNDAYAEARAFTKRRATSFYYAFASLPRAKRNAIYAAYAFSGFVDDAVDEAGTDEERAERLAGARALLDAAYRGDIGTERNNNGTNGDTAWLGIALAAAADRYSIPKSYFEELIAGMEQDLHQTRYATYAELEQYCYRAASMIGLICIEIFGYDPKRADLAHEAAIEMGMALQITNIMRDVREDAERDRIYLAAEDLAMYGVSEDDIKASRYDAPFRALMADYGRRAEAFYAGGLRLLPLLDGPRSRMCCNGLQGVYRSLLTEIIRRDYDVFRERVSPSKTGRLLLLLRLWITGAWPRR